MLSWLGWALVAAGVAAFVGLCVIGLIRGRSALARAIGAGLTVAGIGLVYYMGVGFWTLSPPQFIGLSLGQTLVLIATITTTGLVLRWLPRRAETLRQRS